MHRVAIPVTAGMPMFELAVPCEVFGPRQDFPAPWWYEVQLCAAQDEPARTAEGLIFDGAFGLTELREADTVIVPACADVQDDPPAALLAALRAAYDRGARIASICTGAFTLAAAGLLDNRPATTHWMNAAELSRRWPAVRVTPDVLYTDDGQLLTSAGASAGLDLCLHIVRQDHGTRIANALARRPGPGWFRSSSPQSLLSGMVSGRRRPLLLVALDLGDRAHGGVIRVLAELAPGPALPEQVPALVERFLGGLQPLPFRAAGQ